MAGLIVYFKGHSGILEHFDCEGNKISEGDILTFDWFENLPNATLVKRFHNEMERESYMNKPCFVVKAKYGGLYGEGLEDIAGLFGNSRLYLHDFRFKFTKIIPPQ